MEVRNRAKFAVLTINNACSSSRELEGLLLKARLTDKQKEKVHKVISSEDFESLSNYNNTKYGAMRTSSNAIGAGIQGRST